MKKLCEGYKVPVDISNGLEYSIADDDNELICAYIKDIYVDIFENTSIITGDELETLTANVDVSSDLGDAGVDKELRKLSEFMREHGIEFAQESIVNEEVVTSCTIEDLKNKAFDIGCQEGFEGRSDLYKFLSECKTSMTFDEWQSVLHSFEEGAQSKQLCLNTEDDDFVEFDFETEKAPLQEGEGVDETFNEDFEPDDINNIEIK